MGLADALVEHPITSLVTSLLLVIMYLVYSALREQANTEAAQQMDQLYTSASNTVETIALIGTIALAAGIVMWLKNQA